MPEHIEDYIAEAHLERVWRVLKRETNRKTGFCDISNARLASILGKSERTIKRYTKALDERGLIQKILRPSSKGCRFNESNRYIVLDLGGSIWKGRRPSGGGDTSGTQIHPDVLNTNTPAQETRGSECEPAKSNHHLRWENRRLRDELASVRMRGVYVERGKRWFEMQQGRLHKAYERTRMALHASVGVYVPKPPTPEQEIEWESARIELARMKAAGR
jgi:hypothetical protein